jgi:hypothetical protein
MKNTNMPSIAHLDANTLNTLTTEVKETLAEPTSIHPAAPARFGVIDLWKIHRNSKSAHLKWRSVL